MFNNLKLDPQNYPLSVLDDYKLLCNAIKGRVADNKNIVFVVPPTDFLVELNVKSYNFYFRVKSLKVRGHIVEYFIEWSPSNQNKVEPNSSSNLKNDRVLDILDYWFGLIKRYYYEYPSNVSDPVKHTKDDIYTDAEIVDEYTDEGPLVKGKQKMIYYLLEDVKSSLIENSHTYEVSDLILQVSDIQERLVSISNQAISKELVNIFQEINKRSTVLLRICATEVVLLIVRELFLPGWNKVKLLLDIPL